MPDNAADDGRGDRARTPRAAEAAAHRDRCLALSDAALLAECTVDTYRASGPGGQKCNKTDSAVRLRHGPSGLIVIAEESRSQHENKSRALRRLRAALALRIRTPCAPHPALVAAIRAAAAAGMWWSPRRPEYWPAVAALLDALDAGGGRMRRAAAAFGLTTGQLSKALTRDAKVLAEANRIRRAAGLAQLRGG